MSYLDEFEMKVLKQELDKGYLGYFGFEEFLSIGFREKVEDSTNGYDFFYASLVVNGQILYFNHFFDYVEQFNKDKFRNNMNGWLQKHISDYNSTLGIMFTHTGVTILNSIHTGVIIANMKAKYEGSYNDKGSKAFPEGFRGHLREFMSDKIREEKDILFQDLYEYVDKCFKPKSWY